MALFEAVHNYYEHLVYLHVRETLTEGEQRHPDRFLEDVACLALNQLPARYVRDDVDTGFFLSEGELEKMEVAVNEAVSRAIAIVSANPKGPHTVPKAAETP